MVSVGIVGASGYTGLELIRLVLNHPNMHLSHIFSRTYSGQKLSDVFPQFPLQSIVFNSFDGADLNGLELDLLFLALPHGESHALGPILESFEGSVIDLSADFRLNDIDTYNATYDQHHESPHLNDAFVLGLPELKRHSLTSTRYVACPGCYSTSVILALWPLVQKAFNMDHVIVDAKSGMTGAGRTPKVNSLFVERSNSFAAYTSGVHRHIPEIRQEIKCSVTMTNYFLPIRRGIISTCYLPNQPNWSQTQLITAFQDVYKDEPFIRIVDDIHYISTAHVEGTNYCLLFPFIQNDTILIFSVIDNLMKGAASQGIQCANILFGDPETTGLMGFS